MKPFLLYGSYGYTGELIAAQALREGLSPLLAGRDAARLKAQAESLGLEYRAFPLSDGAALDSALREAQLVVHAAGPFVHTYRPMVEACLRTGRHYVDISGEIPGFEALAALDEQAKAAGIMLLPGGGFDVVPSDCLAAHLKRLLPSATHLRLFIRGTGAGASRGTLTSAIENMQRGGMLRRDGMLVRVPVGWRTPRVDFGRGPIQTALIGWGDVSTAYHSTGIPNVETYMALPRTLVNAMPLTNAFMPVLSSRPVKALLKSLLRFLPPGPPADRREKGIALLLGEVTDDAGGVARSRLQTREGYTLTAMTAVEIAKRILAGDFKPGFQTPSLAYGPDFILSFPGSHRTDL